MLNVGFVGLGGMGMGQAGTFAQVAGVRVAAGADPSGPAQQAFGQQYPGATVYPDYRPLLRDTRIDAVVVVTPTLYHKDVAIAAMKSGRPVLTEKPMARSVADCHRMNDAAERTGKLLMVGHCRRFDTDWGTWAKIYRSGKLGAPVLWRHVNTSLITFGGPWFMDHKLSGGPLMDGAVHNYDFANLLFGRPDHVIASTIKLTDKSALDTGTAVVRYESGDQLMMCWTWGIRGPHVMDVLAPRGSLTFGPADLADAKLDTRTYGYYMTADPMREKKKLIRFKRRDMYVAQAKHFVACIHGKEKCLTPGREAIKAVAVAEAVLQAGPKGTAVKVKW